MKSIKKGKFKIYYRNKEEFQATYDEIFKREEYQFFSEKDDLFIIDCGSHIGLSILYFKNKFPEAKILGFEPNPENFKILKKNVKENKLDNVTLTNAALSDKTGIADLWVKRKKKNRWTFGDSIVENLWYKKDECRKIKIKTVKLSSYINENIDCLKLDVEGAEGIIVQEIEGKLKFVNRMFLEFHGRKSNKKINDLIKITKILKKNNFQLKFPLRELRFLVPEIFWRFSTKDWNGKIYAFKKN